MRCQLSSACAPWFNNFKVHELGIAESILERVSTESRRHAKHVVKVGVRIGELSGVDPEALSFGFEALVKDTELEPLALEIEWCPRLQRCHPCDRDFPAPDSRTDCPQCGNLATECIAGQELDIAFMEVEDQ